MLKTIDKKIQATHKNTINDRPKKWKSNSRHRCHVSGNCFSQKHGLVCGQWLRAYVSTVYYTRTASRRPCVVSQTTHNVYIYRGKPRGGPAHVPRRARPWTPMKASDTAGAWWRCRTGRRVKTLGFRFQVSGLRFQGAGIKAKISGSRVKRSAFGAQSFGLRV